MVGKETLVRRYRIVRGVLKQYPTLYVLQKKGLLWGWNYVSPHASEHEALEALDNELNPRSPEVIYDTGSD